MYIYVFIIKEKKLKNEEAVVRGLCPLKAPAALPV